jgi:hypothetical protein
MEGNRELISFILFRAIDDTSGRAVQEQPKLDRNIHPLIIGPRASQFIGNLN